MIRLVIIAIVLSTLSGSLGAGLAACRNWTMGPPTATDTAAAASPNPAGVRETPTSETGRPGAALERERAARRAAERRIEQMAQPQATPERPAPQPPVPSAPMTTPEPPAPSRWQPRRLRPLPRRSLCR